MFDKESKKNKVKANDFNLVETILRKLRNRSLARGNLTQNWQVCRKEGRLWIKS